MRRALLSHFNAVDAGDLIIPWMPLTEQGQTVAQLDSAVRRIDVIKARVERQATLLTEHRHAR